MCALVESKVPIRHVAGRSGITIAAGGVTLDMPWMNPDTGFGLRGWAKSTSTA
jgi:hypothetical protein